MAQIKLTVSPQIENAKFEQLKQQIKAVATELTSLNKVPIAKDVTVQLDALARSLNAAAREAKNNIKNEKDNALILQRTTSATLNLAKARDHDAAAALKEKKNVEESHKTHLIATQGLAEMAAKYVQLQISMKLIYAPLQLIGKAFTSLNETLKVTEDRVIEVKRALGDEAIANKQISEDIYDLAVQYGQTFDNASNIAVKFARSGMEWRDAIKATEAALLSLNVAELDSEQASSGLIAIMAQFRLEAGDLTTVIDELNKTADNFPVTTEKLLLALQRTGSAAVNANLSLEQTIGLITSLSKATGRSGNNLGTAINSLIQYSSKSSALNIFSSLSDDVAAAVEKMRMGAGSILDVWQEVSKVIKNADDRQKEILTGLAESEDITNLAEELHDELGDIFEQTQEVYGTANTFRKNYFIALLDNIDTVLNAENVAQGARGYSQKENLQYMDTLTAKTTALQTKWESLANDEQGWLKFRKGLADMGIGLLNIVEMTGGLSTAFVGLASVATMVFGSRIAGAIKDMVVSLKSAEGAAFSFSTVLGGIGLAVTIIVQLVNYFQALAEKEKYATEAMREYVDEVKRLDESRQESRSEIEYLDKLIEKYDKLNNKTQLTIAEKYDLQQIVDALKNTYSSLNFVLDETTGKYNIQTEAIKKNREELLKQIEFEYKQKQAKLAYEKYAEELVKQGYLDISQVRTRFADTIIGITENEQHRESLRRRQHGLTYRQSVEFDQTDRALREEQKILGEIIKLYDTYIKYVDAISGSGSGSGSDQGGGTGKTIYSDLVADIEAAKNALAESLKIQEKQNSVLEAQKALEEAIAKAKRDYINSVLDEYITSLNDALTLEQKQNAVIEARKGLEEAAQKAKINALVAALNAEKKGNEDALAIEEKRLAVEQARRELDAARGQRNIRVYDGNRWVENQRDIKSAEDKLSEAVNSLNTYLEQQARDEVVKAIEDGNGDTATIKEIIDKWAVYGIGSQEWADSIMSLVSEYENYAPTAEDLEDATAKVTSAIDELNKYLKDKAIKEIKDQISENGVNPQKIQEILSHWLGMGEGGEINAWGADIAAKIREAATSGYYDTSKVQSQQNALQKAREALSSFYADAMWDEAKTLAQNKGGYMDFQNLFAKYRGLGVDESTIKLISDLVDASGLIGRAVPSNGKPVGGIGRKDALYDSGGILNGIGGIKATNRPEMVLPPNIAERLLTPTTNAQFERVIKSMGILLDTAERTINPEIVPRQSVTNAHYGNNTNYNVNGVTIPAAYAEQHTLKELLDNMPLFRGRA